MGKNSSLEGESEVPFYSHTTDRSISGLKKLAVNRFTAEFFETVGAREQFSTRFFFKFRWKFKKIKTFIKIGKSYDKILNIFLVYLNFLFLKVIDIFG